MKSPLLCILLAFSVPVFAQQLDTTFDGGYTLNNGYDGSVNKMLLQPDGKIVSAYDDWFASSSTYSWVKLSRTNPDGSRDSTFGGDGIASTIWVGQDAAAYDVALQANGKYVLCGKATYCLAICGAQNLVVARYNQDGTIDSTFGLNGVVKGNDIFDSSAVMTSYADRVFVLPSGKIIVTGSVSLNANPNGVFSYVTRLNANGTRDNTFGVNGVTLLGNSWQFMYGSSAMDANGNIYVTGSTYPGTNPPYYDGYLYKLLPTGGTATTFGNGGWTRFSYTGYYPNAKRLRIRNDGKFLICGYLADSSYSAWHGYITLLDQNGALSNDIPGGTREFNFPGLQYGEIRGIDVLGDNHILYTGIIDSSVNWHTYCVIGRLNADGSDDLSFTGTSGSVTWNFGVFTTYQAGTFMNDILQQPDGKILVGGTRDPAPNAAWLQFTILRVIPDSIIQWNMGVSEPNAETKISVFPNPATNKIYFSRENLPATITICDITGRIAIREEFEKGENAVDVSDLNSGVYFIEVKTAKGISTGRFVKQ